MSEEKLMLTPQQVALYEKQQYRIVGSHSGVKICGWTKNMIKGLGGCYKLKFYGIMSHQCMQMTTSFSCSNRCVFCWRDYKAPTSKEWMWAMDNPEFILEGSLHAQKKLLEGYGGNEKANPHAFKQSKTVKHVALSLNGEPIQYPKINELIDMFHEKKISTFLVTNSQHDEEIKNLKEITQLYVSVDGPNKEILKIVDKPLNLDFWERFNNSIKYLSEKKGRTAIRITMIKTVNDVLPENYADIIKRSNVDFVEIKGYMHVGASQGRLNRECMPDHNEVISFANEIIPFLDNYELVSEHKPSRVILLVKKDFKIDGKWKTWIDFNKFFDVVKKDNFDKHEYSKITPPNLIGFSDETNKIINGRSIFHKINDKETGFKHICESGEESNINN